MIELGSTLRAAREAKGLTVTQLAETTKLAPSVIENLEDDNFSRIAAPIYGRGFVKLYCEAVGLDPKPHVAEYMNIVTGAHEPTIKERVTAPQPEPPVAAPEPPAVAPEPPVVEPEPIAVEPEPPAIAPEPPAAAPTPPADDLFSFSASPAPAPAAPTPEPTREEGGFSRYAAPIRHDERPSSFAALWRLGVLCAGTVAVIALIIWGLCALFRVLSTAPADATAADTPVAAPVVTESAEPSPAKDAVPAKESAPRTPQKIPDLYID